MNVLLGVLEKPISSTGDQAKISRSEIALPSVKRLERCHGEKWSGGLRKRRVDSEGPPQGGFGRHPSEDIETQGQP